MHSDAKPTTVQGNLAKLPRTLAPLIERRQWCNWCWTQKPDGTWQKPQFMSTQPGRHASTNDPNTWTDYATALAAVQAGHADGISYVLTKDDPFGAIDLDHCRDKLCSIDVWAQNFMQAAVNTYQEITPSGEGVRIWGFADGDPLNRKFTLDINNKPIAAELFRRTNKALTITGYRLNTVQQLTNIDKVFDWAVVWGEQRKAQEQKETPLNANDFNGSGCKYSIDQIEQIVRKGPPAGANRSDVFHAIVGHYVGCGWQVDRILEHLQQYSDGIGSRYLAEDRLRQEIERSAGKYAKSELPLFDGWTGREAPQPEAPSQEKEPPAIDDDPALDEPEPEPASDIEDDDLDDDEDLDEDIPEQDPNLPRLHSHGSPDPRPLKAWLIKHLIPHVGHGLMSGQWGAGKTFACFVLGIDHFGKNLEAGTRGASSKEASGDVVLACLGDKQLSGSVTNTRLAVRKHRGGQQGLEYPFSLRMVETPEKDEDGDAITTMVIDWLPPGSVQAAPAPDDPWAKPKRQDQRTAALRLKRVLMTILAEQGVDLPIPPDGPVVRMIDQKLVRKAFYTCTPTEEGTPKQKTEFRRKRFSRALDWAEDEELIGVSEIDGATYLWLRPMSQDEEEPEN